MNETDFRGRRFEIFLEHLLKNMGFLNVMRDVKYFRGDAHRQIDVSYNHMTGKGIEWTIVEAKYRRKDPVKYKIRSGEVHMKAQRKKGLDNIVDKLEEARLFVGADMACLVTNSFFEEDVHACAEQYGISVIEGKHLTEIRRRVGMVKNISSFDPRRGYRPSSRIYLS